MKPTFEGSDRYYCERGTALKTLIPLTARGTGAEKGQRFVIPGGDNVLVLAARTYQRHYDKTSVGKELEVLWGTKVVTIDFLENSYTFEAKIRQAAWDYFSLIRSTKND